MNPINDMDWHLIWSVLKDTVLPHLGTLTLHTILFSIIGFILFMIYIIVLSKKKILKRKTKYYNWAVKLYIPLFLCIFLYVFVQIGFVSGIYKILNKENKNIVTGIYGETLGFAFETEASKNSFIKEIQASA